ncbi:MAG TPA: alpha-amylase family glycosyl hydrolase [Candidatus Limnocylindrales bacterium]|nr:alpha-amylase family glycosyl hydrolase [Candidatus Limnocylindrales bacterium]
MSERSTGGTPTPLPVQRPVYGDEDWWRHGVVYQIYPRSYADSDGDGTGDLPGITSKLDYLDELGVDAIWLSPIYPSPGHDVGYDVSDHTAVDPRFGSEADFDRLVDEAHRRGIRVILDLVMNHTSDEHPWFKASRASREGPYADWYLWMDPSGYAADGRPLPPNNWLSWFGGPAWEWDAGRGQFYMHTFLVQQPELNWRNPAVEKAQFDMVRGWLSRGVDGFRLDVFNAFLKHPELLANPEIEGATLWARQRHLYDRDQPDFPDLIGRFRAILDERPGRMSVGELFASEAERAVELTTERHMVFDWALLAAPWSAEAYGDAIWLRESMFGDDRWLANVLSNHDQSRQASRLSASAGIADADAVARAAAVVLLTIRGTPFMYYGEEIGLGDVTVPEDEIIDPPARRALIDPDFEWWNRDGCRSPMPWTGYPGHGFTTGKPWLRFGDGAASRNVAAQQEDPGSVLATYRRVIALRRSSEALRSGTLRLVETGTSDVLSWSREVAREQILVVVNFADAPRETHVGSDGVAYRALTGSHLDPASPTPAGDLSLRPLEAVVLRAE